MVLWTRSGSRSRIRRQLLLAGAASLLLADVAAAQQASSSAEAQDAEVSEVVVTGSQLRGVPPVGSALVSVGPEEILKSGAISTTQILNEVPQIFNIGKSETSRGNTGGNSNITYGSSINIRGLSPYATLVLVDGHRMVRQEPRAESVDPSHIPSNMLQRVEVVADGSSAIYGSDAIAGVANLILRRRFDGVETRVSYGQSNIGNYQEYLGQITAGRTFERGQITAGVEYMYHSNLAQEHLPYDTRDQVRLGGSDIRTNACFPGNIQIGNTFFPIPEGGVTPANANQLVAGPPRLCELFKTADVTPEQERVSFAFTFDLELTDRVAFYAMGYASHRHFNIYNTPTALTLTVPSTNAYYVAPPGVTVPLCSAAVNARFGTPAGTRCLTVFHNVINDVGTQNPVTGFATPYEIIGGFRIDLPRDWQLTVDHTHGLNAERSFDRSYFRTHAANLNRALASSDPATAINVFGGPSPRAVIDNTSPIGVFNQIFDPGGHIILNVTAAKVEGPLFKLPGGTVRMAAGVQRDRMDWWSNNATGPLTAPLYRTPQRAERTNDSIFVEVNVPLVGPDNQLPFVQALDVNLAGRQDKYNDVGRTRNPKVGFRWVPVDGLRVHGSYGTSFRSPNVLDLYQVGNNVNVNSSLFDPTVGRGVVAISLSGGNPEVKPETAETWSLGFDYTPDYVPGLRVGLNYFNLKIEDQIGAFLSDGGVLGKEDELAGTGVITRVPNVEFVQNLLRTKVVTSGTLPADLSLVKIILDGRPLNLGGTRTAGFDVNASYDIPTDNWGDFTVGVVGIRFTKYKDQVTPNSPWVDRLNDIFFPPKWRARYFVDWDRGPWSARVTYNYLNPYNNTLVAEGQEVNATTTTDLHLSYDVGALSFAPWARDIQVALDVTNVFDQDPPVVLGHGTGVFGATNATSTNNGAGYDPTKAWTLGRLVAVSIRSRF